MNFALAATLVLPCFAQSLLEYDAAANLEYRENRIAARPGVSVFAATYASPLGGRAECHVVVPSRPGQSAGIVWQHGGGQQWTWFLPDAIELARGGAVSILMTAPWDRAKENRAPASKDEFQQTLMDDRRVVVDARRAYDALASRPGVDPRRIGYVGLSYGAMLGGTLAGVDNRFRTFVLIAGVESFARHWAESPLMADMRAKTPKTDLNKLIATIGPIEAAANIGRSSAPILFQAARFDAGVPEQHAIDFYKAAGEPKQLRWYDTGHMINSPQAFRDRIEWLRKHLHIQ